MVNLSMPMPTPDTGGIPYSKHLSKKRKGLTSDEIAERSNLSRGTVIHHLTTLAEQGLIQVEDKKYKLRVQDLETLVQDIHKEINLVLKELEDAAEELDEVLL